MNGTKDATPATAHGGGERAGDEWLHHILDASTERGRTIDAQRARLPAVRSHNTLAA